MLKNLKTSGWKQKSFWKIWKRLKAKKLLKNLKTSGWKNCKFEKKVTFLILNCVESMLDLNRSFNRSRRVFFSKVYIIPKYCNLSTLPVTPFKSVSGWVCIVYLLYLGLLILHLLYFLHQSVTATIGALILSFLSMAAPLTSKTLSSLSLSL